MAEENSVLHRIPYSGTFKDIADWLNANFHLIELAIKQNTGKSAYEVWRDYEDEHGNQPNIDKTEQEFLASLKESGYKMQAVTVRPSTIAGIEADKIYLYPDGTGQFSTAIYTGDLESSYDSTKWVVLATNPGDLSGAFTDINGLRTDVNNLSTLVGYFTCDTAAATAAKTVTATGYVLTTGGNIRIKMEHTNTASSPVTLQIGNAAAKQLYYNGEPASSDNTWEDNEVIVVYYDGTSYYATNSLGGGGSNGDAENIHYDNTESGMSATNVQDAIDGIADKTERLTTLDNINTNLIDPAEVVPGYTLNNQGALTQNSNAATSGFIPVEEGKTYTIFAPLVDGTQGNATVLRAYNSNKNHIYYSLDGSDVGTYTVPSGSGVMYIRIVGASNNKTGNPNADKLFGCFEGENATFDEWHEDVHQLQYNDGIAFEDKDNNTLVNKGDVVGAITDVVNPLEEEIEELQPTKDTAGLFRKFDSVSPNLVDSTKVTQGSYYTIGGTLTYDNRLAHTDFIPVEYGKTYTIFSPQVTDGTIGSARFVTAFNENKQIFSFSYNAGGENISSYSIPDGFKDVVKYIVISGASNALFSNPDAYKLFGCIEGENVEFEE